MHHARQGKGPREAALEDWAPGLAARAAPGVTLAYFDAATSSGTISSATMLMILMSGFTAGPAVSL